MLIINRPQFASDLISAPVAADFALRLKTRRWWGNPLCNVRRSSDNAARDIYHTKEGDFDAYDALSFVGAGNTGYVTTWYDQSGNGRNATQGTSTAQPVIVNAGALVTLGGKPAIKNSATSLLTCSAFSPFSSGFTVNAVLNQTTSAGTVVLSTSSGRNSAPSMYIDNSTNLIGIARIGSAASLSSLSTTINSSFITTWNTAAAASGGTQTTDVFKNGSSGGTVSLSGMAAYTGMVLLNDGSGLSGLIGQASEIIILIGVASTTDRQTLERNQGTYYGITVQ